MLKTHIPYIDLRGKTPTDLLRAFPDKATALLIASRRTLGLFSYVVSAALLPLSDSLSRRWLKRSRNPYLHEIETAAGLVAKKGVYTLNVAYEWGCTGGAYAVGEQVAMLRVLDWPFPALGKHMVVAHQQGVAGDYYNVTWPALSGVYQAMAPGRFAAAINQAPMRMYGLGFIGDWAINRILMKRKRGLPPAHLLRQVFDQARSYQEAKDMLCATPLAIPAIFTLTGVAPGEGCVIERLETSAEIKELSAAQNVTCSNEFHSAFAGKGKGWRPRAVDSAGRYRQSAEISGQDMRSDHFEWLRAPIINVYTRLVMRADAADASLLVYGYEGHMPVTNAFTLTPLAKDQ